ncbi:unnamed protein product [Calicophoron daubneyi]
MSSGLDIFKSVRKVCASENTLTLVTFSAFDNLKHLDLSFNQMYRVDSVKNHFDQLQHLDLSYNFLHPEALEEIGLLPSLVKLLLTGAGLTRLPRDMAAPDSDQKGKITQRFTNLEVLHLDDNKLSDSQDFASLATLPKLRLLNLANNQFKCVPLLKSVTSPAELEEFGVSTSNPSHSTSTMTLGTSSNSEARENSSKTTTPIEPYLSRTPSPSSRKSTAVCSLELGITNNRNEPQISDALGEAGNRSKVVMGKAISLKTIHRIHDEKKRESRTERKLPSLSSARMREMMSWSDRNPLAPRVCIAGEFLDMDQANRIAAFRNQHTKERKPLSSYSKASLRAGLSNQLHAMRSTGKNNPLPKAGVDSLRSKRTITKITSSSTQSLTTLTQATKSSRVPPPFPALQLLDLSHNQIAFEEYLLPAGVWPNLQEFTIYGNPVCGHFFGTPPLLRRLLMHRLGLNLRCNPNVPTWFDSNGEMKTKNHFTNVSGNPLAEKIPIRLLTEPHKVLPNVSSTRQLMNLKQSSLKTRRHANIVPIAVPSLLGRNQLMKPPKVKKLQPDKLVAELHRKQSDQYGSLTASPSQETPVGSPVQAGESTRHSDKPVPESSTNETISRIETNRWLTSPSSLPRSMVLPENEPIPEDVQTTSSSGGRDSVEDDKNLLAGGDSFYTTQMAKITNEWPLSSDIPQNTMRISRPCSRGNDEDVERVAEMLDEQLSLAVSEDHSPPAPGPLLPQLEWLVDEESLPQTMQACLSELRHLCEHRPTIHITPPSATKTSPGSELIPGLIKNATSRDLHLNSALEDKPTCGGDLRKWSDYMTHEEMLTNTGPIVIQENFNHNCSKLTLGSKPVSRKPNQPALKNVGFKSPCQEANGPGKPKRDRPPKELIRQ